MTNSADTFHHRKKNLVSIVSLLAVLFGVFIFAVLLGPGYDPNSSHALWAMIIGLSLRVSPDVSTADQSELSPTRPMSLLSVFR